MRYRGAGLHVVFALLLACCCISAGAQAMLPAPAINLTVLDEIGLPVPGAEITLFQLGHTPVQLQTDFAGRCTYLLKNAAPYRLVIQKPGFYQAETEQPDPSRVSIEVKLLHDQVVYQEVDVVSTSAGIDPEQTSDKFSFNTQEIVNIPYPTSRDIRNLLSFTPGVIQDGTGQIHVAGSPTYATLDLLDGFDIRSPVSGQLAMRISTDAVRSIDMETTRYPVQYGKATGGVVAFNTGMGNNKFRWNATDFVPSFRQLNGLRFDKIAPRLTLSGPIIRDRAWFFDGADLEYDNIYVQELPAGADDNRLMRGSNLLKTQANFTPANIVSAGVLFNDYHSPYDGLSALNPQESTTRTSIIAWLPYIRNQHIFSNGNLLELGFGMTRFRDSYAPHGDTPYEITPELTQGSYFESLSSYSQREQGTATYYVAPREWKGLHELQAGIDVDHISFGETLARTPVSYLREDGTLLRRSVFPGVAPADGHNFEVGSFLQDRWSTRSGLLIEPGLRFDWDEIVRRPVFSPRLAGTYSPPGAGTKTKLSAGVGLYYDHSQLQYLEQASAGIRFDTYYASDGVTPVSDPLESIFTANYGQLRLPRALNWSVGVERELPGSLYAGFNFLEKRTSNAFAYANLQTPGELYGTYQLTNARQDNYKSEEFDLTRTFAGGYKLFGAYTHSSAHTNAALGYVPGISLLGVQQGGPLLWDIPNRVVSWGWLPVLLPHLEHNWDFVYTLDWHSGFPYDAVNANYQVVGAAGSYRFPNYVSFSPGLEWRFHLGRYYFGLRGVLENATDSKNPALVNNNVDSPDFGMFSENLGRSITSRLRLISSK